MWALGQSALIIPFIMISLIFGEEMSMVKIVGTVLIVAGMFAVSRKKNDSDNTRYPNPAWGIGLALIAFCVLGIAQTMTSTCGRLGFDDRFGLRPVYYTIGCFMVIWFGKAIKGEFKINLNKEMLIVASLMSLNTLLSLYLQFKGIDALSSAEQGGLFFPIALGCCIGGFAIYSRLFLRERLHWVNALGLIVILCGVGCYSFA